MMIAIDTNVLVRSVVQADPEQSGKAAASIQAGSTTAQAGHARAVVPGEVVWVLKRAYG